MSLMHAWTSSEIATVCCCHRSKKKDLFGSYHLFVRARRHMISSHAPRADDQQEVAAAKQRQDLAMTTASEAMCV